MKTKEIVKRIFLFIFGLLPFISLAFPFLTLKVSGGVGDYGSTQSGNISFTEWIDSIKQENLDGLTPGMTQEALTNWKVAEIFYIIFFVLLGLAIIGAVAQFFIKNKYLNIAVQVLGVLSLLTVLIATITNIAGQAQLSRGMDILGVYVTFSILPHAGFILISLAGIIASSIAIACNLKTKKKKNKK